MEPVAMLIWCPMCSERHLDEGIWATKPHHTHSCQKCGLTWRPAVVHTVGVQFLPGFKNEALTLSEAPSTERLDDSVCGCTEPAHNEMFPERHR